MADLISICISKTAFGINGVFSKNIAKVFGSSAV